MGWDNKDAQQVIKLEPTEFSFNIPGAPCTHWYNGRHIFVKGECKCGKKFMLLEVVDA